MTSLTTRSAPVDCFSLAYDRAPEDRIGRPTRVLWPAHDPLFPREWSDRLESYFSDVTVRPMPEAGHFSPLEAPQAFATAIRELL